MAWQTLTKRLSRSLVGNWFWSHPVQSPFKWFQAEPDRSAIRTGDIPAEITPPDLENSFLTHFRGRGGVGRPEGRGALAKGDPGGRRPGRMPRFNRLRHLPFERLIRH